MWLGGKLCVFVECGQERWERGGDRIGINGLFTQDSKMGEGGQYVGNRSPYKSLSKL